MYIYIYIYTHIYIFIYIVCIHTYCVALQVPEANTMAHVPTVKRNAGGAGPRQCWCEAGGSRCQPLVED